MNEAPHPPDFIVRYFLEVSTPAPATGMCKSFSPRPHLVLTASSPRPHSSQSAPNLFPDAPNMVACWSAVTGKVRSQAIQNVTDRTTFFSEIDWLWSQPCRPYDDTNTVIHQQILFNMGKNSTPCGSPTSNLGCPRHHVSPSLPMHHPFAVLVHALMVCSRSDIETEH